MSFCALFVLLMYIGVIPRWIFCVRPVILCGCVDPRDVINCVSDLYSLFEGVDPCDVVCVRFVLLMSRCISS